MPCLTRPITIRFLSLALLVAAAGITASAQQNHPQSTRAATKVVLQPRFTPGQVMRYRMTVESDSSTHQTGSIKDPQGPAALNITWEAIIRLEVSAGEKAAAGSSRRAAAGAPVRLRITYESSRSTVRTDTVEPQADAIQQQYARLAGQSIEFTLDPGGHVSDIRGLEGVLADDKARSAAEQWILQLAAASAAPAGGMVPGRKWNSTQAAELPLAGLSWRTDSTYMRNESCALAAADAGTSAAGAQPRAEPADCAVLLSRLALITTREVRDSTPDDYRRNNLHTSGHWNGSGQSLIYVSLDSGWVVSSTQDSTQEMDVTIEDAGPNPTGTVRTAGSVTTRSQVSLLGDASPVSAPSAPAPNLPRR